MTNDDLLLMAWKAGIAVIKEPNHWEFGGDEASFRNFAALVAASEREDILQMSADNWYKTQKDYDDAIRERKL